MKALVLLVADRGSGRQAAAPRNDHRGSARSRQHSSSEGSCSRDGHGAKAPHQSQARASPPAIVPAHRPSSFEKPTRSYRGPIAPSDPTISYSCFFTPNHVAGPPCSSKRSSRLDSRSSSSSQNEERTDSLTSSLQPLPLPTNPTLSSNLPFGSISTLSSWTNSQNVNLTAPNKLSSTSPSWLSPLPSASPASAKSNNPQVLSKPPQSRSPTAQPPFLKGVHRPTNDNASAPSPSFLNISSQHRRSSTPVAAATAAPISLRAHLEAAISNPSSPYAQANLLRQLQSTLAAVRPSPPHVHAAAAAAAPAKSPAPATPAQPTFARVPSITPAAVASALAAAAAGRRHTLSSSSASPAAATINSLTPAQKQRLEQIRHYQQLIAQLNATMPAAATTAADTSVAALLPFEARAADHTKVESGFNAASLGLNPMSADDPSWIGHGFQAHAAEDFLSSPDWTDPSPALTDSMSFEIDSCGPSPLLPLDSYDDDLGVPGIAGAPLFPPQDGYASSNVSPLELASHDFGVHTAGDFGAPEMSSDFSLFPDAKPIKLPVEMAFSKLGKPAAGSASSTEDPALTLLRALSS
ncbi:hypothetical protein PANT_19c00126, partial [Moesziomyces antarcticus T-34]